MTISYSPSTGLFYSSDVTYVPAPDDLVTISDDLHATLLQGQATGATIGYDPATQLPVNVPHPTVAPTVQSATVALQSAFAAKSASGVYFTPTNGTATLFPTDDAAIGKYNAAYSAANANPVLWPASGIMFASDGSPVVLGPNNVTALAQHAFAFISACAAHYADLYNQIKNDPTTDITQGWPSNA